MKRVVTPTRLAGGVAWACLLAILTPPVATAQEAPPRPFLRKVIQLDDAQLAAVEKGDVVTKLLPTTDKQAVAIFNQGIVDYVTARPASRRT